MVNRYLRFSVLRCEAVVVCGFVVVCFWLSALSAVSAQNSNEKISGSAETKSAYLLGPDDEITVRALDVDEIDGKNARRCV